MTLSVKSPILGFENIKSVTIEKIDEIFVKMNDADSATSFPMIDPFVIRPDYEFITPTYYADLLGINDQSELKIYNMLVVSSPIEESYVNFMAPVVCNLTTGAMCQVVLDPVHYPQFGQAEKLSKYIQK